MTGGLIQALTLALPIATAGIMLATAAGMGRAPRRVARWTGVTLALAVAAYALKLWNDQVLVLPDFITFPRAVLAVGTVGWFWLFVMALFEDVDRIGAGRIAAVAGLTVGAVAATYAEEPYNIWLWLIVYPVQIVLALHALVIIVQGWKGDLVEPRRRLRGPFLATVALYILTLRSLDILRMLGLGSNWYAAANSTALFLVCLAGSLVFLGSRAELFGPIPAPAHRRASRVDAISGAGGCTGPAGELILDRAAKADLERLQALMEVEQVWREEGLTIASLAVRVNMPEAQLRRLINDQLGYRNFPSFVNAHRIAQAKARLADPGEARTPVSAIAFDIGFGSLGPFNRAFRQETGLSPSEWRRRALGDADAP